MTAAPAGLAALEQRLAKDLHCLGWPARSWMPRRMRAAGDGDAELLDVAIIGGGQSGLAASAALTQLGIRSVVFDSAPAGLEGPWATTARMETLRSPKELTGPALGLAALTFRAWFEAQFGDAAWTQLDKIPRMQWMDYLRWYRRVMAIEVRNDSLITAIMPRADGSVWLDVQTPDGKAAVSARRVVLATGRDGLGGPLVPPFVEGISKSSWAHSSDVMDYGQLAGLRVGVVGAGASAMDSAATALEAGAKSVELLIRRAEMPRINKSKGAGVQGLVQGHFDLPDEHKWRIRHYINVESVPPPRGSTQRVARHANAFFNFGCPIDGVQQQGDVLCIQTPKGQYWVDFLIVSTGFKVDWYKRPEFAAIAPHVRAWRDRYTPLPGQDDAELEDSPDVGPVFELLEKTPGACPGLDHIHCFCYPATLSHGALSGDIPSISDGARRLANGIASLFYSEDFEQHFATLKAYDEPELMGDEWTAALPPALRTTPIAKANTTEKI